MQSNHKLKHAVTAALSIIAFGFHSSSYALGLGDIDVKSNLGQPLKARVNILGAGDLKDTSCIRLGPNSDLGHVNFILGQLSGDVAKLTLTSNKVINEPILNLSIVAGCDSVITRDYVLLLDPPLSTQANNIQTNNAVIVQKIDSSVETSTTISALPTQKTKPKPKTNARNKSPSSKKAMVKNLKKTNSLAKQSSGTADVELKHTPNIKPATTQPRLSISGGSYVTSHANTVGLRLDRQLSFTPDPSAAILSENIAIEDEVTVMNKRLAHLQSQITTLQTQNLKLASENKLKSAQLTQSDSFQTRLASILPFIGTGLLLIGGYVTFNWLRRRQALLQNHETEAIWTNTTLEQDDTMSKESRVATKENIFEKIDFGINDSAEDSQLAPDSMEVAFESTKTDEQSIMLEDDQQFSVLDHADVFLSHGRSTLAIQLLQNHLLEHPKQSVTIWLFLLDLLAKENLESLYLQTTEDCKLHFNVKIAEFSRPETISNESLEDFPHLAQGLESVWNTPAAVVYLDDLIYNNRLEPRAGLAKNLIEELVLLRSMAQENVNSAEVIHLGEKKLAMIEKKEALLETRKAEKLKEMVEAERVERVKAVAKAEAENNSTDFEFTLIEKY